MAVAATFSLSEVQNQEIDALVKAGEYTSKSDVAKDALRCLFLHNPSLKLNAAIQLYKENKVSIGRAAEIAGMNTIDFKEVLIERQITLNTLPPFKDRIKRGIAVVQQLRKK